MIPDDALRFFTPPPFPADEDNRQAAVDRLRVERIADDPRLKAIVARAAALFDTSAAVISIIDRDRQRWIVRQGVEGEGTARAISFCGHTVLQPGAVLSVPDARQDARFAGNPLVMGENPAVLFYTGAALMQEGAALGSLCVIDSRPHEADDAKGEALRRLAAEAVAIFDELADED